MRADDGSALSPLSTAVMAYIQQRLQEKAQAGVPTAARESLRRNAPPTAERTQSKAMQAEVANQSAPVMRKQIEAGPSTSASTAVRRQRESDATMNGASVQDSHPITVKQEQIKPGPSMSASAAVQQPPKADVIVNGASVQDSHPTTIKQEQIEPGPSTSANAAIPFAGGESAGDVKLKKIVKVELQRGRKSYYTGKIPASLKVTEESGETREIFHFAQLDGCLVDEMVFECRDKTTDKLVRQLYKDKSIAVHVKRLVVRKLGGGHSYDHFESGIKRLQDLAEALRSLQLIVWEGMTGKHLFKLSSFVSRKLVFEYPVDLDDLDITTENFAERLRRAGEPPVKVEKYFTLPAPPSTPSADTSTR